MHKIRRGFITAGLSAAAAAVWGGFPARALAQSPRKLAPKLRLVIPAVSRSSLDNTGRALGDALVIAGRCDEIEYENSDAKGGAMGIAYFADKYARDPNSLLIADSNVFGAAALQKSAVDISRLQPVARMVSDYLTLVVPAGSPVKATGELLERLKSSPKQTPIAIGNAGSLDHVFAGLLVKSAGSSLEEAAYLPHARSFEMVDAVVSGKAAVGISGYGTFSAELASKKLRAIGVSSRKGVYALKSMREQGVDVDLTNWRAVFTGQGVPAARSAEMVEAVKAAMADDSWKKALKQGYWEPSWMTGPDLMGFLEIDIKTTQVMMQLLKLKA
jgi:putative tricarboxylic transport membrane protein